MTDHSKSLNGLALGRCAILHTLLTLILYFALAGPAAADSVSVSLSGRVIYPDSTHVRSVTIIVEDQTHVPLRTASPDNLGSFGPVLMLLPSGRYSLRAKASGYSGEVVFFDVPHDSERVLVNVTLELRPLAMTGPGNGSHFLEGENYAVIKVFYATDRVHTGKPNPAKAFGSDRGALSFGTCSVSIPRDHRMGHFERPSVWRLEFREDPGRHVVLLDVTPTDTMSFFSALREEVNYSAKRSAFVFVHGFNTTFDDAARRTAQFCYDLGFEGAPILFSWPSRGRESGYMADEETVVTSEPHLVEFLRLVRERSGATTIHLVAHSLGARLLALALKDLADQNPPVGVLFTQLVLTAPDIDVDAFRDFQRRFRKLADRVTLYASSRDLALRASRVFHESPRAGESGGHLVVLPDMDTIDVSSVDTGLLGHFYFQDNKSVLSDLFNLLRTGRPPGERFGLRPVTVPGGVYWAFRP